MNSVLNICTCSCGNGTRKSGIRRGLTALTLVFSIVFFTCGVDVYAALSVNKAQTAVLSGFTCKKSGDAGNAGDVAGSMAKIKTGDMAGSMAKIKTGDVAGSMAKTKTAGRDWSMAKSVNKKGPRKFGSSCVTLSRESFAYDGKAKKPTVKVTYGGKKLKKDRDYKVFYKNNVRRGKASVIVEGRGDFRGSKVTRKFRIK